MSRSDSLMLRLGGVAAAGALLAVVAGCSSGGSSSSAAPPVGSASSASSAAGTASGAASTPASLSSSSSPRGTGGGAGGVAGCVTGNLKVAVANTQGAAGSVYQNIDFTNAGAASCSLYGYPGVSLGTGTPFNQVGAAAARSTAASPAAVTLAPGQTANALLRVVQAENYPSATCSPTATTTLRIYPPDETSPLYLPFKATGCTSPSVKLLTIGVVQPGSGNGS